VLFGLSALLLDVVYYLRLRSTVGVSIRARWFSIASFLGVTGELILNSSESDIANNILQGCFYIVLSVIPLFAIGRMEFSWHGFRRLPVIFAHASHLERASSRIDAKSSWSFTGTVNTTFTGLKKSCSLTASSVHAHIGAVHLLGRSFPT
jgi:hypothetical protein